MNRRRPSATCLKLPVFWSSRKLTSLRGGASALPPLSHLSPSFTHCLPCSYGKNCTPTRRRRQQSRRSRIPAQHRRAAMTRSPALLPPKKITSCSYRRCCLAATALAVTFTATAPLSQSRLWNACLRRVERLVHQPRSNLFSRQPSAAATATKASNIHFHAWRHQCCPP